MVYLERMSTFCERKKMMKLRNRLLTAFLIIILFPCGMIGMIGSVILANQVNFIEEGYMVDTDNWEVLTEPTQILNRMTRGIFNELCVLAEKNSAYFLQEDSLKQMNEKLQEKCSYLAVEKNGEVIYSGNQTHYDGIASLLPEADSIGAVLYDGGVYVGGETPFLAKQQKLVFSDGETGSFCIITDANAFVERLKSAATFGIMWGIAIIVATAFILVGWLYLGILRPLNALRSATRQLQEGNLDFSLKDNISDDEIGQLCQDFEEMRIHLKEEIEVRIQYEQELRELISNISHDIKTPLTAIKGYAEGLIDGVADTPEKQEKYLKTIYAKANDMTVLVDELSFYAKIDTNTIPYHFERVRVNDYFADCVEENMEELGMINLHLEFFSNVSEKTEVMADREQLHRVMSNLIGNAVKYRGEREEGSVTIRLWDDVSDVRVEVTDTGQGIGEKDLPNIFDRFYRADASRNSKQGGTGLGLAIVKKIIEEHGGQIHAESTPGKGTSIIFTLKKVESTEKKGEVEHV